MREPEGILRGLRSYINPPIPHLSPFGCREYPYYSHPALWQRDGANVASRLDLNALFLSLHFPIAWGTQQADAVALICLVINITHTGANEKKAPQGAFS